MEKNNLTRKLVIIAMFVAIEVVLTRFLSIHTPFARIGLGFLPIAMLGIMYGPLTAGLSYAAGDLIGATLFPTGPFFPGFTLTVFLTGIVYGSFLHKHGPRSSNLVAASIMVVAIRMGLDTLWLGILFDDSYLALMPVRLVKGLIDIPLQIVLIPLLWTVIAKTPIKTQIDKSAA